jgi:uncharacterized caspase-like protein
MILPAAAERRVALVIGNAAYQNTTTLANPANDALDMAAALEKVGFTVQVERDLTKRGMEAALSRFARAADGADAALFFYAGHGVQYRGSNYLVPVDARLEDEISIAYELLRLDDVQFSLERARGVKLLLLDACRNNPLLDRLVRRSGTRDTPLTRGLARVDGARGMVIAYATQADQVAVDGTGRNSPFTEALIKYLAEPGLEVGTLLRRVAIEVDRATSGRQLPETWVTLRDEFYLNARESDLQAWARARDSDDPDQLADFIRRFPNSQFAPDLRQRLEAVISRQQRSQAERERNERARAEAERAERLRKEQAEVERVAKEQAERERLAREAAARTEAERAELLRKEQAEAARREAERAANEQAERERLAREAAVRELAEREQAARRRQQNESNAQIAMVPPPGSAAAKALSGAALVRGIKTELKRVGCLSGEVDERWSTRQTKSSITRFVKFARLTNTSDLPTTAFLDELKRAQGRICPLECGVRQVEKDGQCVVKICPAGHHLTADGNCVATVKPKPARQTSAKPHRGGGGRRCFSLGGQSFCE